MLFDFRQLRLIVRVQAHFGCAGYELATGRWFSRQTL